MRNMIW